MNEDDEEIGVDMGPATEPHSKRELELVRDNNRLREIIDKLKVAFAPQYNALMRLYENESPRPTEREEPQREALRLNPARHNFALFLSKAGKGVRGKMLRAMIEHKTLSKKQLATIADTKLSSSSFKDSLSWLRSNGLVNISGENVSLEAK